MSRYWRKVRGGMIALAALGLVGPGACGGSSGGDDAAAPDVSADPGGAEAQTDLPGDPGSDPGTTPDAEVQPDAPIDVDWDALPRLPLDKTFTTRYAAGVGVKEVSPDHSVAMGGFGFCGGAAAACRWTEGVHDPLYASAAAFADTQTGEVAILVGVDSVGFIRPDIEDIHHATQVAIYERFGTYLEGHRVIVTATHSHASPDATGIWGPNSEPRDIAYITFLKDQVAAAAVEAYGDLQDARLDWGKGSAPNYDDDTFGDDDEVYVIRARTPADEPILVLARWVAHPTGYGSGNNAASADYMGPFRKRVEAAVGAPSIYINGPIGSVYATKLDPCGEGDQFPEGWQDPDVSAQDHERVTCVGLNLAAQVLAALEDTTPVAETGLKSRYTIFEFHPTNLAFMLLAKIGQIPIEYVDVKDPESRMTSHLSWVTLGDLDILSTPGEAFPSFANKGKDLLIAAGFKTPITLGLAQDWMGYLMTNEAWAEENDETTYHKGLSASSDLEDPFLAAIQALIDAE